MRPVRWILILLVLLAGVFALGGMGLPDRAVVERDIRIERPPATVYALLDGFGRFNEWSPWRDYDPSALYEISGPEHGVGARMRWSGAKGSGVQEIVEVEPPHRIVVALDFGEQGTALSRFLLTPAGGGTRLTWQLESDARGSWLGRWFNLLLDRMVGPDYERGLAALKALAESEPPAPMPAPDTEQEQEPLDASPGADEAEDAEAAPEPARRDDSAQDG
ncbi:MAG: hypothetical protein KatS3mg126_0792 [Lysobacteraceae bacterium]|nr:MAG: hypothetical protein KatS3mg126_0792 [Xanthomonadaceae bacterium]